MKRPKVSVVIPIYNASKFMRRTVDNLVSQTLDEVEILFIDNESTDDSSALAGRAANKYSQVRFYKQFKPGVSAARNLGIEKSKGECIVFMDDDDIVTDDILARLFDAMKNVDMSVCGFETWQNDEKVFETQDEALQIYDADKLIDELFSDNPSYRYIWNKMYKKSIIDKYNLRFDEDIHYNEDRLFLMQYLMHCEKVRQIPDKCYFFQRHDAAAIKLSMNDGRPSYRALTSVEAFYKMLCESYKLNDEELTKKIQDMMVREEFKLIEKMLDNVNYNYYRTAPFRRYVHKSLKFKYVPRDEREEFLYKKLKLYVVLGTTKREKLG